MSIVLDGTTGITTPGLTNTGTETIVNLTTTGNTILGDASTDTLNVGNGGLVKDASGNVGIGTSSPSRKLVVSNAGAAGFEFGAGVGAGSGNEVLNYNRSTSLYIPSSAYASTHTFYAGTAGGTRALDIDSSGNVGIGATPGTILDVFKNTGNDNTLTTIRISTVFSPGDQFSARLSAAKNLSGAPYAQVMGPKDGNGWLAFTTGTSDTERMRIDSAGLLCIGTTSAYATNSKVSIAVTNATGHGMTFRPDSAASYRAINFSNSAGSANVGFIDCTTSATTYSTSSDYRLKHDITPMSGALAKVGLLKPVTYKWNLDDSESQGFIAHELQAVVPECVTGEKDAVDADGNPVYQGIDTSFLVATLTAAIQELKALVDTQASTITQLQADVASLKGTP